MVDETKPDMPDPKAKSGSDIATASAATTGTAEPKETLAKTLPGETLAEKIESRFARFRGTKLANDTETWNLVHAFKEDVKALVAEHS